MLMSMTGYGSGQAERDGLFVRVEVRTVNHRYLDLNLRMPPAFFALEHLVRRQIRERLTRGRVDVHVALDRERTTEKKVVVDYGLLAGYKQALTEVRQVLPLAGEPDWAWLQAVPGLFTIEEEQPDEEHLLPIVREALDEALHAVLEMRKREGEVLAADLCTVLQRLQTLSDDIRVRAPAQGELIRTRLQERLASWEESGDVDPQRLAMEVALLADKADINEELARLQSHLQQFSEYVASPEAAARTQPFPAKAVGKRLDFLTQEMHRELNTIGAKAVDPHISDWVVAGKSELERLREQVQNIE